MKTKILYSFLILCALFSCVAEDELKTSSSSEIQSIKISDNGGNRSFITCDTNYVFPILSPDDPDYSACVTLSITYDSSLTAEEIHCIRYEYFTQYIPFGAAFMCVFQPTDPYQDCWKVLFAKPDQTTGTTICDDPRMNVSPCDDD